MSLADLRAQFEMGLGMALATRDAEMRPELTDVFGGELSADGKSFTFFVNESESRRAVENLNANGEAAVTVSRPLNYIAAQIKGRVRKIRAARPEEIALSRAQTQKYRDDIQLVGVTRQTIEAARLEADLAIDMDVQEIYDQTPGPGAGRAWGSA